MNKIADTNALEELPAFAPLSRPQDMVDNIRLPPKVYKFPDESTYQGGINDNDEREGFGLNVTTEGDFYRGDWKGNKPNGLGRFVRFNGDYYQGGFEDGKPHGQGIGKEGSNGIKYTGDWVYGMKTGYGREDCPDGSFFEGKNILLEFI